MSISEAARDNVLLSSLIYMLLATAFHSPSCNILGCSRPALLLLSWSIAVFHLDGCKSLPAPFLTWPSFSHPCCISGLVNEARMVVMVCGKQ